MRAEQSGLGAHEQERASSAVDRLLTLDEVAGYLNVSVRTVRRLVASQRMPCVRIGRRVVRFDPADVRRFLAARRG